MNLISPGADGIEDHNLDPARVPPGQYLTDRFPVLHAGFVPDVDLTTWEFTVEGVGIGRASVELG